MENLRRYAQLTRVTNVRTQCNFQFNCLATAKEKKKGKKRNRKKERKKISAEFLSREI